MPYAIFDYMGAFLRNSFAYVDNVIPVMIGTFRNLPPEPTPTYAIIQRNPPKTSRTCLRNLHHFTPQLSGTFRNLPLEPTPFYTGTLRNLPEPASGTHTSTRRNSPEPSGTCPCDPHRHTPELIWAEDPISLRCWGKKVNFRVV